MYTCGKRSHSSPWQSVRLCRTPGTQTGKKGVHFTLLTTFQAELVTIKTSTMNLQFMYCLQPGIIIVN